jgi:hypothetical protein
VDRYDDRRRQRSLTRDELDEVVEAVWERLQIQLSKLAFRGIAIILGSSGVMAFAWDALKEALKK